MLKFFKNIFHQKTFPAETTTGKVEVDADQLKVFDTESIRSGVIDLTKLSYVYIAIDWNQKPLLYCFDFTEHYVPVNFEGFQKVYEYLSNRFGFDDSTFFKYIDHPSSIRKQIWRAKKEMNYEILKNSPSDSSFGYEIQSPVKELVTWDLSYDNLERHPSVVFEKSPFGQKIQKYTHPIRIGSIVLSGFGSYFDNGRSDAPVLHFYAHCYNKEGNDQSYFDLKKALYDILGGAAYKSGYERNDQKCITFEAHGMIFNLVYTYTTDWCYESGHTTFSVQNNRDYPELLLNEDYETKIQIDASLVLEGAIEMNQEYKRSARIKKRPDKITEQFKNKTVVWRDDRNRRIGFASGNFCQLFEKDELLSLAIQNIIPAKGGGGSYLELILSNRDYPYAVFTERYQFFNQYKDDIAALLQLELQMKEEYHDC